MVFRAATGNQRPCRLSPDHILRDRVVRVAVAVAVSHAKIRPATRARLESARDYDLGSVQRELNDEETEENHALARDAWLIAVRDIGRFEGMGRTCFSGVTGILQRSKIKEFIVELTRRRVIQFALTYAIGAWILIEVSSVFLPAFGAPDWALRIVILTVAAAFVPALGLAWVFDFTLHGIERTEDVPAQPAYALPPEIDGAIASIAVLPFHDLVTPEKPGIFAEGIASEIHAMLCNIQRLRVIPRRSSFSFPDRSASLAELASALNARYILSGTVISAGTRVQVTAELDDAQSNTQVWSRKFERELDDVLALMSEIAESVVAKFSGEQLRSEITEALAQPTESLDAWSAVQRARGYILDYSADSFSSAEAALRKAVDLDPHYSAARATLGSILAEKVLNGFSSDEEADSEQALDMIKIAQSQSPADPFVLKMSATVYSFSGDPLRAIQALRSSVEIAPYDFGAWGFLGWPLVATGEARDLDELHTVLERILNTAPEHPGAAYWLHHRAAAYLCSDELDEAKICAERSIAKHRGLSWAWLTYANVVGRLGNHEAAREAVAEALQLNAHMSAAHYAHRLEVMTIDQPTFVRRTEGLRAAGFLDEPGPDGRHRNAIAPGV